MTATTPAELIGSQREPETPERPAEATDVALLVTAGLSKSYGGRRALRNVALSLAAGERLAVLGPNGAGKSTLVRLLALLTRPTSGTIAIGGLDAARNAREVRRLLGVVLHESLLYPDLTAAENLAFAARLYGVSNPRGRLAALIDQFALDRLADRRVRALSRGQRQRVSLARALVHDPPILLLDEPNTGLDGRSLELMTRVLCSSAGRTVIFTTHDTAHALELGTRTVLLHEGRAADLGGTERWSASTLDRVLFEAAGTRPAPERLPR